MKKPSYIKKSAFFACAVMCILFTAVTAGCMSPPLVRGNGRIQTKSFSLKDFTAVSLGGKWEAEIRQGENFNVEIDIDDNLFDYLDVYVSDKTLHIETERGINIRSTRSRVTVTMPSLTAFRGSGSVRTDIRGFNDITRDVSVHVSGSGTVNADISVKSLTVKASGSSSFTLKGKTENFSASISGSGKIRAFDFKADNVDMHISGSGSAQVHAEKTLNARISGSGSLTYTGTPRLDINTSGSAKVVSAH